MNLQSIKDFFNFKAMSKQKKILMVAALAGIVVLTIYTVGGGFSSSNSIKVVPKNTAGVAIVDLGALYDKADVDELLELDLVQDGVRFIKRMSGNMPFSDIINNPNESGIDLHSEIFIFSSLSLDQQYGCASIGISDGDKFNKLIKEAVGLASLGMDGININDNDDGYKYIVYAERWENFGLAWDNEVLLFISALESRVDEDDIEDELERLMTLESGEKITDNNNFNDFYSDKTDICAWVSTDLIEDLVPGSMANMFIKEASKELRRESGIDIDLSFDDLLGNSAAWFFNFGEGNISIKSGIYLNDKIQELVEEVSGIDPEELSLEIILTFDASGRNSLNAIIMTVYNVAETFGKELIKDAIDDGLDFDFGDAKSDVSEGYRYDRYEDDYYYGDETAEEAADDGDYYDEYYDDYDEEYYDDYDEEYYDDYDEEYYDDYDEEYYDDYDEEYYDDYDEEYYDDYDEEYYDDEY